MNISQTNILNEVQVVQVQLEFLKRKQDLLLGELITHAVKTATTAEINEIINIIPSGFYKSELKMWLTDKKTRNVLTAG